MKVDRVLIVPRWYGEPDTDWYAWFSRSILADGSVRAAVPLAMPMPQVPKIERWVPFLAGALGGERDALASTVLVGHSVGCHAVVRSLATLPDGAAVRGLLLVAGWWWLDDPWPNALPWLEVPARLDRIRRAAGEVVVLVSEGDPWASEPRRNGELWAERLGADVVVVKDAGHFTRAEEPDVLSTFRERFGDQPSKGGRSR